MQLRVRFEGVTIDVGGSRHSVWDSLAHAVVPIAWEWMIKQKLVDLDVHKPEAANGAAHEDAPSSSAAEV